MKDRPPPLRLRLAEARERFRSDERGFVLVFVAVALPALLGLLGLAVDGSRLLTLDTQLAGIADSAALAGAARLDRSPGAIINARAAANALLNQASFASGADPRTTLSFRFAADLSELRGSPTFTLADSEGSSAVYVEVTTASRSLATSFLQLVGVQPTPIRRRAVAEAQYYACDVTPALLCQRDPDAFVARAARGRQYRFRYDGGNEDGAVALLDPPGDPGGRQALRTLASNAPEFCYTERATLRPFLGEGAFHDALNIRFDRYSNRQGPIDPDLSAYPPAPNVLQGRRFESCRSPLEIGDNNPPYRLPRDSAFRDLRVPSEYDSGGGDWKLTAAYTGSGSPTARTALDEYLFWNHSDKSLLFQDSLRVSGSRYEVYLKELGLTEASETEPAPTRGVGRAAATLPSGGPRVGPYSFTTERAVPVCWRGAQEPAEARRRILYLSIVDCRNYADYAGAGPLSRNVGKFFLTEPSTPGAVLLEFVNMVRPTRSDGKLRRVVRLVDVN